MSDLDIESYCNLFLNDMEGAADADIEILNNKSGVALEKLKMLVNVKKVLSNNMFHEFLLQVGVLKVR